MRKRRATKREVLPDALYKSKVVTKLINQVMNDGKKGTAQKIVYDAFAIIEKKTGEEAMTVFEKAMDNIKPVLEVKSRKVSGANYQVPIEVKDHRRQTLAFRWLIQYSKSRSEHSMAEKLANEIIDASNGIGASVKKKEDTHKMAEANKAFAHYKW